MSDRDNRNLNFAHLGTFQCTVRHRWKYGSWSIPFSSFFFCLLCFRVFFGDITSRLNPLSNRSVTGQGRVIIGMVDLFDGKFCSKSFQTIFICHVSALYVPSSPHANMVLFTWGVCLISIQVRHEVCKNSIVNRRQCRLLTCFQAISSLLFLRMMLGSVNLARCTLKLVLNTLQNILHMFACIDK